MINYHFLKFLRVFYKKLLIVLCIGSHLGEDIYPLNTEREKSNHILCLNWLPEAVICFCIFLNLLYFDSPDSMSVLVTKRN